MRTRGHTHSSLPPHPHVHSNISSIVLTKKTLGVPDSGVHQPRCPEHISPRHPLTHSYTHVQKRRHTKTPVDTLIRTETTLHCLALVRARPGAPACYFWGSQSSLLSSSVPRGRASQATSTFCAVPIQEWRKPACWPRESRELGVRRPHRRAEGGWSWMPRGTWRKSP